MKQSIIASFVAALTATILLLSCSKSAPKAQAESAPQQKVWKVAEFANGSCVLYQSGPVERIWSFGGYAHSDGSASLYITVCNNYSTVAMSR